MIAPDARDREDRLDLFIDGLMGEKERASLAREIERDPELREEIRRQALIDEALGRLLAPPSEPELRRLVEDAIRSREPARERVLRFPRSLRSLAVAASILLAIAGGWLVWRAVAPAAPPFRPYALGEPRTLVDAYGDEVAAGFRPAWICRDDAEFARTFRERFGQPLLLEAPEGDRSVLGLCYAHTLSPWTLGLLARADGRPVIVFVDRVERDSAPQVPDTSGLHLHRHVLGSLVLYELSPLESATFLDGFRIPPEGAGGEPPRDTETGS